MLRVFRSVNQGHVLWKLIVLHCRPSLSEEVSKLTEENFLFKNENRNFQEQLSQLHEKLRKKQESFLNIQDEKEKIFKDLR
jgi:hypothetical protein